MLKQLGLVAMALFITTLTVACGDDSGSPQPTSDSQVSGDSRFCPSSTLGCKDGSVDSLPPDSGPGKPDALACTVSPDMLVKWSCPGYDTDCEGSNITGTVFFSPCFWCNDCPVIGKDGKLTCKVGKENKTVVCTKK